MNGIWTSKDADHHQVSDKLAKWMQVFMQKKGCTTFCDFGCGNGYYVDSFLKYGLHGIGIEGNRDGVVWDKNIIIADLTTKMVFEHDCSISLEVGEHLSKEFQEIFMQNICHSAKKVLILSWAEIGQPGIGHVNCRSQKDVIEDVEMRGFKLNKDATKEARENVDDNTDWLKRNLLVFERNG